MKVEEDVKRLDLVLLVDDDETTNYINQRVIGKAGIARHVDLVHNGEEALQYLRQQQTTEKADNHRTPDLMLVDIKMAVMDGFEFLDEYQHLAPELKAKTVIMLSSSASFYDLHRLQQYPDVARHIAKPLTVAHLQEIMEQYFS